jgi:hypothetical protein
VGKKRNELLKEKKPRTGSVCNEWPVALPLLLGVIGFRFDPFATLFISSGGSESFAEQKAAVGRKYTRESFSRTQQQTKQHPTHAQHST